MSSLSDIRANFSGSAAELDEIEVLYNKKYVISSIPLIFTQQSTYSQRHPPSTSSTDTTISSLKL